MFRNVVLSSLGVTEAFINEMFLSLLSTFLPSLHLLQPVILNVM